MASASDFIGGSIKIGDNLRIDNFVFLDSQTNADGTVMTRSGKGVIDQISFRNRGTANLKVNSIKVTIDGASERTLTTSDTFTGMSSTNGGYFHLSIPIRYKTSITIKVNYTSGSLAGDGICTLTHSIG
jgi:hypothetical protein